MFKPKPMGNSSSVTQDWAFILVSNYMLKDGSSTFKLHLLDFAQLLFVFSTGELPLSLAACTNQPDIVSFLMENPYSCADVTDKDSQGNTVLHTLVVIATDNTDMITRIYDAILIQHSKLEKKRVHLEAIENNQGLTPLKLAAKLGKLGVRLFYLMSVCLFVYFQRG